MHGWMDGWMDGWRERGDSNAGYEPISHFETGFFSLQFSAMSQFHILKPASSLCNFQLSM